VLTRLKNWYVHELKKAGVTLVTDHAVSTQELIDLHADAVLVATGSRAAKPGFAAEALASGAAVTAEEALRNTPSGNHVLILGGGLVGCETAEKLALQGKSVTILELRAELAPDMHPRARKFLLKSLREHGARFLLNTLVVAMERNGIGVVPGTYFGGAVGKDIPCLTDTSIFIMSKGVSEEDAYKVTKSLVEGCKELGIIQPAWSTLDPQKMPLNMVLPLHPGAKKYYREAGLLK